MEYIFVYGSLMSDYIYKTITKSTLQTEKSPGILTNFKRVCVKNMIYPAIIRQSSGTVHGILRKIPKNHLEILDHFEGDQYSREVVQVHVSDKIINAWVYVWKKSLDELEMKDWDYKSFLLQQEKWVEDEHEISVVFDTGTRN